MKRNDFREQAKDLISEYGAQYELDGDYVIWWFEADKKKTTKLPMQTADLYRGLKNSAAKWKRELEEVRPVHFILQNQSDAEKRELEHYVDNRIARLEAIFNAKLETLQGDVITSTDISLETGSKLDSFMKFFQGAFTQSQQGATLTLPSSAPKMVEHPKVAIAPNLPKTPHTKEEPKGFDVLEQVRAKQWADALKKINEEFELDDLKGRILYFLHECGACTPHDLKLSGVWKSSDSVTRFLEDMEADPHRFVRFLMAEKKWAITNKGIYALKEGEESQDDAVAPEPIASKPILTVVPTAPARRILEPIRASRVMPPNLSVKDELLIYLYWNEQDGIAPKTTSELKMVVPPLRLQPSNKDIGTVASAANGTGQIAQEHRGGPWLLTRLGRDHAMSKLSKPVGYDELRHKFGK